jgi:putative membrane protein
MSSVVRQHTPAVTAILSSLSIGIVFAAAGGAVPTETLPRAPEALLDAIPHINAAISLMAIATITLGVRAIRAGEIARHRSLMFASFGLFVVFLAGYLYRVSLLGPTEFSGPAVVGTFVYYPILAIHILLAVVCIPLLYHTMLLAATYSPHELSETIHPRLGRIAAPLWLVSFLLGFVVYLLVYLAPAVVW